MAKKKSKGKKRPPKKVVKKKKKKSLFEKWGFFQQDLPVTEKSYFSKLFLGALAVTLILMCTMSFDFGIAGDETDMHQYGQDLVEYYSTFGGSKKFQEHSGYNPNGILKYYGGLFDVTAEGLNSILKPSDPYAVRHFICAVFGFLAILFAALIAYRIGGYPMAFVTLLMLLLSPRFIGHAMNNTKDIPFASTYIAAIYFILEYIRKLQKPTIKTIIPAVIAIGCCINTRAGGILLIPYLFLFVFIEALLQYPKLIKQVKEGNRKAMYPYTLYPVAIAFGGYLFSSLLWPYALENPIANPLNALKTMSEYPVFIRCLFEGERLQSSELPWYYIPKWMWLTVPVVILTGFLISLVAMFTHLKYRSTRFVGYVAVTCILPIAYAIVQRSNLYDGWRHFIFIYPSFVIMSAFGWYALYMKSQSISTITKNVVLGIGILGLSYPLFWSIKNYPNQPVFYNLWSGGVKKNNGVYEMDYYMNSVKQACNWLKQNIDPEAEIVVASTTSEQVRHYMRDMPNVQVVYTRYYERYSRRKWDYAIFYNRFLDPWQLSNDIYPTSNMIHTVEVDGVPLVAVYKDENGYAKDGMEAYEKGDTEAAIENLTKEIELHSDNEIALRTLATIYLNSNQLEQAKPIIDRLLEVHKTDVQATSLLGTYFLKTNQPELARQAYTEAARTNSENYLALYDLARMDMQQGNYASAYEFLRQSIERQPRFTAAYQLAIQCLEQMGQNQLADNYRKALKSIQ